MSKVSKVVLGIILIIAVVSIIIWNVVNAIDCVADGGIWVTKGFPVGCVGRLNG